MISCSRLLLHAYVTVARSHTCLYVRPQHRQRGCQRLRNGERTRRQRQYNAGITTRSMPLRLPVDNTITSPRPGTVTYAAGWSVKSSTSSHANQRCRLLTDRLLQRTPVTITPTVGTTVHASPRAQLDALPGRRSVTYTATATNSTSITYYLDAASLTAGNSIDLYNCQVTYSAGWSGMSVITATATGCNGPSTATATVTINPTVSTPGAITGTTPVCPGVSGLA